MVLPLAVERERVRKKYIKAVKSNCVVILICLGNNLITVQWLQ
jgi:hypothetical protein